MAEPEMREFDPAILGSITSGILLVDSFSLVHEAIEWIAGHPVWTHELPSLKDQCSNSILSLYPDMPRDNLGDWAKLSDDLRQTYGASIPMPKGSSSRKADPVATLAEMIGERQ